MTPHDERTPEHEPHDPGMIRTQPEPEHIARAGDLLDAVLAGHPDIEIRLAVAAALTELYDVVPPYPPHPEPTASTEPDTGIRRALEQLVEAAHQPGGLEEGLRIGRAARELRPLIDAPDESGAWPESDRP